jgi:hypothetical protein
MKTSLILFALVSAAAVASAAAQTTDTQTARSGNVESGQAFQAPIAAPPPTPAPPAPEISREATQGVVPRALRHGRPWQMLNPGAPARYGQAHENVTHDPNDPGKPKGIKLFELIF